MFAIIRTRTLSTSKEEFKEVFDRNLKDMAYKGWLNRTARKNQLAAKPIFEEFLEKCYKGLDAFEKPVKKQVSENYVDRDLCAQVWDLQADLKVVQKNYSCSDLMEVEEYREFLKRLKPYTETHGWRTFCGVNFILKFTRTVEAI